MSSNWFRCVLPCLLGLPLCLSPAFGQAAASSGPLQQANTLLNKGHLDEALEELDKLAVERPETPGIEQLRGMIFYQQGKMVDAASAFASAVVRDPEDRVSLQMEGVSLLRQGKPAQAIPLLEKAHSSVPQANIDPDYVLGLCYMDARRFDDARKAFAGQYEFAPDSASAYLLAARMLLRRDYLPIAEESARKALLLNPVLPLAHLLLGEIALAQGKIADATAEFEKEATLNPLHGPVYDRLGDAYLRAGDYARAQQSLDRAVLLEPAASVPYILLGKVLLKQQDPLMAKMYLEHALQIDPGNYMAHGLLGQAFRSLGRTEDATREYKAAEQLQAPAALQLDNPK